MITYRETKQFTAAQLEDLFLSVGWESGRFPHRLVSAMANSSRVISAWDGDELVGLIRSLDDGAATAFIHYLLVKPAYQKEHIGGALLEKLLAGYTKYLYIKIMPSDPAVLPFYARYGFQVYDNYRAMEIKRLDTLADLVPGP